MPIHAFEHSYHVKLLPELLQTLRKSIACRLIQLNLRDLYQEPSYTLGNFPPEALRFLCDEFLGEPGFNLSIPQAHCLKLSVHSLRLLHRMLDLGQVGPLYQGGLRFVKSAKQKMVRSIISIALPFVMVSQGEDTKVSFKYVLVDEDGGITPPKEIAWNDLEERRSRIVILEQMKLAAAQPSKQPPLSPRLSLQLNANTLTKTTPEETVAESEEEEEQQQQQ